jgi:formate--tetrahydrofolate ligase
MVDAALFHGTVDLDPHSIAWTRVLDVCDRALRHVVIGLGGKLNGVPREAAFEITAASEVMALLSLTTGLRDVRERLGRIIVGSGRSGKFITAEEIKAAGAMAVLLKDALMPNLVQTLEHTPALIHTGPFGNIADGQSSVIADQIALKLADYVVTESGFGADLGFEKFCHIKARVGGFAPAAAVVVCTVRALKMHSGKFDVKAGKPLPPALMAEDLDALRTGAENLRKHVAIVRSFGVPVVVAVNRFPMDTDAELSTLRALAEEMEVDGVAVSEVYQRGGEGGGELAEAVVRAADKPNDFRPLYDLSASPEEKVKVVAAQVYGADGVAFDAAAQKKLHAYADAGYGNLPVCMAKTQYSLSHDPSLLNTPRGFTLPIRDVRLFAGAGMLVPLCGDILTMPGLSSSPAAMRMDVDEAGNVVGLV